MYFYELKRILAGLSSDILTSRLIQLENEGLTEKYIWHLSNLQYFSFSSLDFSVTNMMASFTTVTLVDNSILFITHMFAKYNA